jgi:hypothetical protein
VPQPCADPQFHRRSVGLIGRFRTDIAGGNSSLHVMGPILVMMVIPDTKLE